jgi:DHA3 family macrolide efflux protein-like MFS transporter
MFLAGFTNPIVNGPFFALLLSKVEPGMQGRVLGLVQSAAAAMMPLSLLIAGPVADALGVGVWYLLGGAATVLVGLVSFAIPAIMHVEDNGHTKAASAVDTTALPRIAVECE